MEEPLEHIVYSKNVIEFVTVAKEFCTFVEGCEHYSRTDFLTVATRIMPLLYIKAAVLPRVEVELDEPVEKMVDEIVYGQIQSLIAEKLGRFNDYLEVFTADMQHSDTPIIAFIAEDFADIYQDLKDFISAYRIGAVEIMNDALSVVQQDFEMYWGQRVVNTLRALHAVLYGEENLEEEEGEETLREERKTDSWFISRMQKDWQEEQED